jgi:hypothetical protein
MNIGRGDTMAVCGIMNTGGNLGGIISLPIIGYLSGRHSWHTCFLVLQRSARPVSWIDPKNAAVQLHRK